MTGRLGWVATAIVYAIAIGPLATGGFPRGHDWSFELTRAAQFATAFRGGQWLPAWAPDLYAGFGSPIFLFYAPGFSALTESFGWLLGTPSAATLVLALAAACAWLGMYRLVRAALPRDDPNAPVAARVAAAFYVLHPYLICDALLRNADAEYLALALAPLPLAGVLEADRRPRVAFGLVAFGLAAVVLSHNLTALVVTAAVVVAAIVRFGPDRDVTVLTRIALALVLGLGMAAFFWLPALTLVDLVRPEELLTGKFDFHRQFPSFGELIGYERHFGAGWLTPAAIVAAGGALALRAAEGAERRLLIGAVVCAILALLLALRVSTPVWETVPFLPLFQFPWRWLGPVALTGGLALGIAAAHGLRVVEPRFRLLVELVALVVIVLNAVPHLRAARPLDPGIQERLPQALAPLSVRSSGQRATVRDEYLPRGAVASLWRSPQPRLPLYRVSDGTDVHVERDSGTEISLNVAASRPARIELTRWAFPDWQVTLDGETHAFVPSGLGLLAVEVPAGRHRIEIRYRAPLVRRLVLPGSGLVLLVTVALVAFGPRRLFS